MEKKEKKNWQTPKMIVYGDMEAITKATKYKTYGQGDDVMVNNQSILGDLS
jgi:hypothetical protein